MNVKCSTRPTYYIGNKLSEIAVKNSWDNKKRNWIVSAYNLSKETPSQALPGGRALEQTYASGQQISPPDLTKMPDDMVTHSFSKVNGKTPQTQSIQPVPTPESREDWLERLKRERRKKGWF